MSHGMPGVGGGYTALAPGHYGRLGQARGRPVHAGWDQRLRELASPRRVDGRGQIVAAAQRRRCGAGPLLVQGDFRTAIGQLMRMGDGEVARSGVAFVDIPVGVNVLVAYGADTQSVSDIAHHLIDRDQAAVGHIAAETDAPGGVRMLVDGLVVEHAR